MPGAIIKYAINWPIAEGKNVYRGGVNTIPVPFVSHILGLIFGALTATLMLFFIGWVVGVGKYALATLR